MIEVKNLTKAYGDHTVVDNLNVKLYNGRIYGIFGADGAGKSTLMNLMTGCLAPTSGTVRINGFDVVKESVKAKKCIGYLPQLPPVYESMTPYEYLMFVAEARGVSYERAMRQVQSVMDMMDLVELRDRLIKNLSDSERLFVSLAQTLMGNPDIILLDEPTKGLAPKQVAEIHSVIRSLGENKTVILSSCFAEEIKELCHHVLILADGRLIANAPVEELSDEDLAKVSSGERIAEPSAEDLQEAEVSKKAARPKKNEKKLVKEPERDGEYELIDDENEQEEGED